jgi:hypothetical protein
VLAALPATPVQLAHACRALGFELAFPASWGDELVADGCLARLAECGSEPAIVCACPYVTERLTRVGAELAPWMLTLVAPPVAAARYLRAVYGERPVHITYVGACPAGSNAIFDARSSPEELLAMFAERGIVPTAQPELFDSVLPPDRRRFSSLPGGAPSPERLAAAGVEHTLVELEDDDALLALAQRLLTRQPELIDLAPRLGCACSGALVDGAPAGARAALVALEPPRARAPVLDPIVQVDVRLPAPSGPLAGALAPRQPDPEGADTRSREGSAAGASASAPSGSDSRAAPAPHRRAPTVVHRRPPSGPPVVRQPDGRLLPRAYAAARRKRTPHVHAHPPAPSSARGAGGTTPARARDERRSTPPAPPSPAEERRSAAAPSAVARLLGSAPHHPLPPPPAGPRRSARVRLAPWMVG